MTEQATVTFKAPTEGGFTEEQLLQLEEIVRCVVQKMDAEGWFDHNHVEEQK